MRGREHPHVHPDQLVAAHALEGPLLQRAQELDLQLGRHVADLVEEDAAAVGQLELAEPALLGIREGALLVAEELGLEQRGRDGRGRDAHEGTAGAAAVVVQGPRHHFLARPGLAAEEHADVARGHAPDGLVDLLHGRVPPHEGAELPDLLEPRLERGDFLREPARRQRALGEQERLVEVEGLGEVVVGALLHGLDGRLHGAVGGHDHHLGIGALPADAAEEGQPVDARHADVEEDQVERLLLGLPKRGGAVLHRRDLVAGAAEALLEDPAESVFVVGDEDAPICHAGHPIARWAGSRTSPSRVPARS